VNLLDLIIVLGAVAAAAGGWRLGFLARSVSWAGMVLAIVVAVRWIVPAVLDGADEADHARALLAELGIILLSAFVGQALGLVAGARLRLALPVGTARRVDHGLGALAGVVGVVAAVWLLVPAGAAAHGWPSEQTRQSTIARAVTRLLPDPPDELGRLLTSGFPEVFADLRAAPDLGPPPVESGLTEEVLRSVAAATFKVEGAACSNIQDGSGVLLGDDLVVTNAHVVAGVDSPFVEVDATGERLDGEVVAFDPDRDVAVLRVSGLDAEPLPLVDAEVGATGGVFGHPGGAPLRIAAFRVGERIDAIGNDIYDRRRTERDILVLSASLAPGDSGAGLVDPSGQVVGVAFAIAPDRGNVAYALAASEVRDVLAEVVAAEVDTGPCLN
jgi:S1-C subfamily serine protease